MLYVACDESTAVQHAKPYAEHGLPVSGLVAELVERLHEKYRHMLSLIRTQSKKLNETQMIRCSVCQEERPMDVKISKNILRERSPPFDRLDEETD